MPSSPSMHSRSTQQTPNSYAMLAAAATATAADPEAQRRSKQADFHHARGYAARKQGNFSAAVEEYSKALVLEQRHFKALFNRGFSYDKVSAALHLLRLRL
jgi:Flp pilus assembly protein TadD